MPGTFGNDSDRHLIFGIGTGIAVLDKNILTLKIGQQPEIEYIKLFRFHRDIDRTPPDLLFTGFFPDNPLIIGRPAGIVAGSYDNRPQMGYDPFPSTDDLFIKNRSGRIPENPPDVLYPMMIQTVMRLSVPQVHDLFSS
jgi:hypothetical protein